MNTLVSNAHPEGIMCTTFSTRSIMTLPPVLVGIVLVTLLLAGCESESPTGAAACTVTIGATADTIGVGATMTVYATTGGATGCDGGVIWTVTPAAGGTITPNGLSATFTATAPGRYTIRATSADDASVSDSATVSAVAYTVPCGEPNGTVVTHTSTIATSETWAGDGVTHRVPASISITGSATVTVEPCAIVELGPGASITVRDNARLVSAGASSARFVTFRRADSSRGWGALYGNTSTSLIDLRFTRLERGGAYGGRQDPTIAVAGNGYGAAPVGVLRTVGVTITGSHGIGVNLDANGAFTDDSDGLTITGSTGRPIHATMMALGSIPAGDYTGNGADEILVHGPGANVFADMTVDDPGVPIRLPFGNMYIGPAPPAIAPVKLTIRPGVILKFPRLAGQAAARLTFGSNGSAPNNVVGILDAVGTPTRPIVFTSGEASPAPGDWVGIWLNTANGSRLEHVEISYAGGPNGIQSNNCRPADTEDQAALLIGSFSDQYVPPADLITNSRITHSAYYAINAMWQEATVDGPDLTATNTFENNARCRQTYNGVLPPGTCPQGGGCTAP